MNTAIENLTHDQRMLRYSICVDYESFRDDNADATPEAFLKAFEADEDWKEGYVDRLKKAGEEFETVFRELYDRHYAN